MQVSQYPRALSASTLIGDKVRNTEGKDVGKLEEIMIDIHDGRVAYAVLSFGGFLGMGDKLFAIPWEGLTVDTDRKEVVVNIAKEKLEKAEGFDKNNWPDTADAQWWSDLYDYYGYEPYWR